MPDAGVIRDSLDETGRVLRSRRAIVPRAGGVGSTEEISMTLTPTRDIGRRGRAAGLGFAAMALVLPSAPVLAQLDEPPAAPPTAECCVHEDITEDYAVIWTGNDPKMAIERLAAYAAPVLWFSPDEPLLKTGPGRRRLKGKDIMLPEPFPFEESPGHAVVYWMTKTRMDDTRVFPPLPPDSPLLIDWTVDGEYAPDNATYTLRPWPTAEEADSHLVQFIADKGPPDWPEIVPDNDLKQLESWLGDESWAKSWAVAARGANDDFGVALAFPLLIFKNVQDPLGGGWFVNRIYFQGSQLEDFGWLINYSPSASRWFDGYFAVGMEWDKQVVDGVESTENYVVTESGIKFRFDLRRTPLKFMSFLGTTFWGLRAGIQFRGVWSFDSIGYVFEFGAGSW
jgi:hypothetical protein